MGKDKINYLLSRRNAQIQRIIDRYDKKIQTQLDKMKNGGWP